MTIEPHTMPSIAPVRARSVVVVLSLAVLVVASVAPLAAQLAGGELTTIRVDRPECIPLGKEHHDGGAKESDDDRYDPEREDNQDNALISATVTSEVPGTATRLFFRWVDDEDFYYVNMAGEGGGRYWGVLPEAAHDNQAVEYYVASVLPNGQVVARSDAATTSVSDDCRVRLTEKQAGMAENLTVGDTTAEQVKDRVTRFLCDGIVTRIGPDGVLRADDRCRVCLIAKVDRKPPLGIIIPAVVGIVGGGILISDDPPAEASPATP